jgi:hypothetical protein
MSGVTRSKRLLHGPQDIITPKKTRAFPAMYGLRARAYGVVMLFRCSSMIPKLLF